MALFTKDTELYYIKQALLARDGFCAPVKDFFKPYMHLTYDEALDEINTNASDEFVCAWMLSNLKLLGKDNTVAINDKIITMLVEHKVSDMQALNLWRQYRHTQAISIETKYFIIKQLRGKLLATETKNEWEFDHE